MCKGSCRNNWGGDNNAQEETGEIITNPATSTTLIVNNSDYKDLPKEDIVSAEIINDYSIVDFSSVESASIAKTKLDIAGADADSDTTFAIQDNDNQADYTDSEPSPESIISEETSEDASSEGTQPDATDVEAVPTEEVQAIQEQLPTKKVAVLDTGVNEIASESVNFTKDNDGDENGHGTKIAQTILDNSNGSASIVSVKVLGNDGQGDMSTIIKGWQYCIDSKVNVINMSFSAIDNGYMFAFKQMVRNCIDAGITVVCAAGNYNASALIYAPSDIEGVISVGTMNDDGTKAEDSNYGATYYEVADSTSEASAIVAGKYAFDYDFSQEVTNDTVVLDATAINASPTVPGKVKTEYDEETGKYHVTQTTYYNVSQEMYVHATSINATHWIFSEEDNGSVCNYIDKQFDKKYGVWFYFYNSEDAWNADQKLFDANTNVGFTASEISKKFSVQTTWGSEGWNGSYYIQAGLDYEPWNGGMWMKLTLWTSASLDRYWAYKASNGGTEHGAVEIGKMTINGYYTVGSWTDYNKHGNLYLWGVTKAVYGGQGYYASTVYYSSTVEVYYQYSNYVYFNANGGTGSMATQEVVHGTSFTTPSNGFSRAGYTFAGWNEKSDGTGTSWTDWIGKAWTWTYTNDITLYAQWRVNSYTIAYNANGGSGSMSTDTVNYGSNYRTKSNAFTRTNYRFKGWNERADGTGTDWTSYINNNWKWTYTRNVTLYAQWEAIAMTFVNYDTNGGAKGTDIVNPSGYTIIDDGVYTLQSQLGAQRYLHVTGGGQDNGSHISIWEGAGWSALDSCWQFERVGNTPYYYITNRNNGLAINIAGDGDAVTSQSYVTELWSQLDGTKDEYSDFLWYLKDAGNGYVWICNKKTNRVLDITDAKDANGTNVITWDNNGGTCQKWKLNALRVHTNAYGQRPLYSGSNVLINNVEPVRNGYVFTGWNTKADGTGTMYQKSLTSMQSPGKITYTGSDVTLYAQWAPLYENSTLDKVMTQYNNELSGDMQSNLLTQTVSQGIYDFYQTDGVTFSYKIGFSNPRTINANKKIDQPTVSRKVYAPGYEELKDYLGNDWTSQNLNKLFFGTTESVNTNVWLRDSRIWYGNQKAMNVFGQDGATYSANESDAIQSRPTYKIKFNTKK